MLVCGLPTPALLPSVRRSRSLSVPFPGDIVAMTGVDFKNAGEEAGLRIWRIQDTRAVPIPFEDYGSFASDSAYVCLVTENTGQATGSKAHNLHFWIGPNAAAEDSEVAAFKLVEVL
jgi:hypothetical protein